MQLHYRLVERLRLVGVIVLSSILAYLRLNKFECVAWAYDVSFSLFYFDVTRTLNLRLIASNHKLNHEPT